MNPPCASTTLPRSDDVACANAEVETRRRSERRRETVRRLITSSLHAISGNEWEVEACAVRAETRATSSWRAGSGSDRVPAAAVTAKSMPQPAHVPARDNRADLRVLFVGVRLTRGPARL